MCEAIYAAAILPIANLVAESNNPTLVLIFFFSQYILQGMFGVCHLYWIDSNLENSSGLSEKKRKTLYCPEAYEPEEEEQHDDDDATQAELINDGASSGINNKGLDVHPQSYSRFLKLDLNASVMSSDNTSNYGFANRFA